MTSAEPTPPKAGAAASASLQLVRSSAAMLAARAAQALLGAASFVLTTRHLGVAGYGELVTALAASGTIGTLLATALSDAQVVSVSARSRWKTWQVLACWIGASFVAAAALQLWTSSLDVAAATMGGGLFIGLSTATTSRVTEARARGDSKALAWLSALGGMVSFAVTGALILSGVRAWGAFVFPLGAQPLVLFFLASPAPPARSAGQEEPHRGWLQAAPYVISQASWLVLGMGAVFLLRIFVGATAVGQLGGMTRFLDLLALVSPIMGTFALPQFVKQFGRRSPSGRIEVARLNGLIALLGTLPVITGAFLGWWAYQFVYPGEPFPSTAFALLTISVGLSAACGLPDRMLQAEGRAREVSLYGVASALVLVGAGIGATLFAGLIGVSAVRAAVFGGVNGSMLRAARPRLEAVMIHLGLAAIVVATSVAIATRLVAMTLPWSITAAILAGLVALASFAPWWARLGRALRQHDGASPGAHHEADDRVPEPGEPLAEVSHTS